MGNIHVVGPNEALIISGGCFGKTRKTTKVGGWGWAWKNISNVQRLSLNLMTLYPRCEMVETLEGVAVSVSGVAQCKVRNNHESLKLASEQFLGKRVSDVVFSLQLTFEGHLRSILGTLSVEEAYKDREKFAKLVRTVASPDVEMMGIQILSFTIRDIFDNVGYLNALGKSRTAEVKRDADIGVAHAERDAGIREAECKKEAMDVVFATDTKIGYSSRLYNLSKSNFDKEVNTAKAEAQLAYELQAAKLQQEIRNEEIQIEVVERKKEIEIEDHEVQRKERELSVLVKLPAEAESYRVHTIAEGSKAEAMEEAKAQGVKIKLLGSADAQATEEVGNANAEMMMAKAEVFKQYEDAAILSLVLDALPRIAGEVNKPLGRTEEIVLLGGSDGGTCGVSRLVSQLPPSVQVLAGKDVGKLLRAACSCPACLVSRDSSPNNTSNTDT